MNDDDKIYDEDDDDDDDDESEGWRDNPNVSVGNATGTLRRFTYKFIPVHTHTGLHNIIFFFSVGEIVLNGLVASRETFVMSLWREGTSIHMCVLGITSGWLYMTYINIISLLQKIVRLFKERADAKTTALPRVPRTGTASKRAPGQKHGRCFSCFLPKRKKIQIGKLWRTAFLTALAQLDEDDGTRHTGTKHKSKQSAVPTPGLGYLARAFFSVGLLCNTHTLFVRFWSQTRICRWVVKLLFFGKALSPMKNEKLSRPRTLRVCDAHGILSRRVYVHFGTWASVETFSGDLRFSEGDFSFVYCLPHTPNCKKVKSNTKKKLHLHCLSLSLLCWQSFFCVRRIQVRLLGNRLHFFTCWCWQSQQTKETDTFLDLFWRLD